MVNHQSYLIEHYKKLDDLKNDFRNINLIDLISSKVKGNMILDIGCGSGHLINILEKRGIKTTGLEPIKELISIAKKRNPNSNIIEGSVEEITTKTTKKFSTITIIDVLEHVSDDIKVIQDLYNRLEEGGYLIIVVPSFPFLFSIRDLSMGHFRRYTKNDLIQKVLKNNFKIKEIRHWNMLGFLPYLIFQKLLKNPEMTNLRTSNKKNMLEKIIIFILHIWFKFIENNLNFGFGLSLVCVAEKPTNL